MGSTALRLTLVLGLVGGQLGGRAAAQATPPAPPAAPAAPSEAELAFTEAVRKFEQGRFDEALKGFERSYELSGRWELLFNIGITHRRRYQYTQADRALARYVELGKDRIPPDRLARVEQERAEILRVASKVAIRVSVDQATVTTDGRVAGRSPLEGPLLLEHGPHVIAAARDGYVDASQTIEVLAGASVDVVLTLRETNPQITITSRPGGAILTLDGRTLGPAPWTGRLAPGQHRLAARLERYQDAHTDYVVVAGQPGMVPLDLVAIPQPWYRRDRVQGGIAFGAVLALAVSVVAVGLLTPDYDERIDLPRR